MASTLVVFHTKGGASGTYAKTMVEALSSLGVQADLVDLRDKVPDIGPYDNVIAGTGIRMGMVYGRWKKVLRQKQLGEKRLFLFLSSGMAMDKPDEAVEKYLRPLVDKLRLKPVAMVSFPGVFPGKWAETEEQKHSMKPEKAREWILGVFGAVGP